MFQQIFNLLSNKFILKRQERKICAISTNKNKSYRINNIKDYSLNSGERQVGETLQEIRKDHIIRYELAKELIDSHRKGRTYNILDIFCGNGYGTYMLGCIESDISVLGIDGSSEAIEIASNHYSLDNIIFCKKIFPFKLPKNSFDFITCFESLEHVENDVLMLDQIYASLRPDALALISVPNQKKHPLEKNPHRFHFRHYTHSDFLAIISGRFLVESWYGQNVYEFSSEEVNTFNLLPSDDMNLVKCNHGQVNIYVLRKEA